MIVLQHTPDHDPLPRWIPIAVAVVFGLIIGIATGVLLILIGCSFR